MMIDSLQARNFNRGTITQKKCGVSPHLRGVCGAAGVEKTVFIWPNSGYFSALRFFVFADFLSDKNQCVFGLKSLILQEKSSFGVLYGYIWKIRGIKRRKKIGTYLSRQRVFHQLPDIITKNRSKSAIILKNLAILQLDRFAEAMSCGSKKA